MIVCRNLGFTYFDAALQGEALQRFQSRLVPGGVLLIGVHEKLPDDRPGFRTWSERLGVYLHATSVPETIAAPG